MSSVKSALVERGLGSTGETACQRVRVGVVCVGGRSPVGRGLARSPEILQGCSLAGADALPREAQRGQEQAPCWAVWDA